MLSHDFTRRTFGTKLASALAGLGIAGAASKASATETGRDVEKLGADGKPVAGTPFIMPIVRHNSVIYIAGIGAHDDRPRAEWDITNQTKKVLDNIKEAVEQGGSSMDRVLQLGVFLTRIEDYDGMNAVFKTYFPNGGPARTTVAVAALPGNSLVEINCIAAVTRK